MRKKIVLINPPRYEVLPMSSFRELPYGLLKIGGHLLEQGHEVILINGIEQRLDLRKTEKIKCGNYKNEGREREIAFLGKPLTEIADILKKIENPDEIWVSSTMTYYWKAVHEVIEIAKEIHPKTPVFLGGIYASLCTDHARKSKADMIHKGPYLPAEKSRTALELLEKIPEFFIIKYTRGCPHNCSYCAVSKLEGHKMDFMETDSFVAELEEKYEKFGIKRFSLWESNLLVDARNRFEKVLDKIIEKRLPIQLKFPEGLQPSLIYPELVWKMKKAGVMRFALPLESASLEVYGRFHKPSTLQQFDRSVNLFKDAGFRPWQIKIFVLIGMPDQTIESIVYSDFKVLAMRCFLSNLSFTPIPGTEEYEKHRQFLKDKSLEELHPAAYPMANPRMTVKDLEAVHCLNENTSLYDLVFMEEGNVSNIFKQLIKEHKVGPEEIEEQTPEISIIEVKNIERYEPSVLKRILKKIRMEGKWYAFYTPLPKCHFIENSKSRGTDMDIPSRCDQCLKLFVEGCPLHNMNKPDKDDINESFRLERENIKDECKSCKYYLRGNCRILCAQLGKKK